MRTALLSTLELTDGARPRAFERLGGRKLIFWQIDLAKDLGCSRIVCLASADSQALRDVREQVESEGLEFHLIGGPRPLVGLLTGDEELVVIADGLVADRTVATQLLGDTRGVVTLPDGAGIAAGFERVDADHAWAGIIVARAQVAQQLADLPQDGDTISLLLRLALQAGTRLVPLGEEALESGEWLLVRDHDALALREQVLIDRSVEQASWRAPSVALGRLIARAVAPDGLDRAHTFAAVVGGVGLSGAIGLSLAGYHVGALVSFLAGSLGFSSRAAILSLQARLRGASKPTDKPAVLKHLVDLGLVATLALPFSLQEAARDLFIPIMLVGLLKLGEALAAAEWKALWADRALLALALVPFALLGVTESALACMCLLMLAFSLFFRRESKITQA